MLKMLRKKKTARRIWILMAVFILPAFVFWGFGGAFRSNKEAGYVGKIYGRRVTLLEYNDAIEAVRNAAIIQFGDRFSEIRRYLDLESQAWQRLLLLEQVRRQGIKTGDREVIATIQGYPFFQRNGQFNRKTYEDVLRYVFRTPARVFEEQLRQNLMISKLYRRITDGVTLSQGETEEEYRKMNEEISVYYAAAIIADFVKGLSPSENETREYFATNPAQFQQPLSFNLEYIVLDSQEKVKNAVLALRKKGNLSKLAKELGVAVKETGLFAQTDPIPQIGWSPEILNLLSQLKTGQFAPPVQMDNQYYILRLKEKKEAYLPEFDKVKDKVRERFLQSKSEGLARASIEKCLNRLKELSHLNPKLADLKKVAKECDLRFNATDYFKYGSYIEGLGASDSLWLAASGLKTGEFSQIISMPSGFFIVKMRGTVPIDEKRFNREKEAFGKKLLLQKKDRYFSKFIEESLSKAR